MEKFSSNESHIWHFYILSLFDRKFHLRSQNRSLRPKQTKNNVLPIARQPPNVRRSRKLCENLTTTLNNAQPTNQAKSSI